MYEIKPNAIYETAAAPVNGNAARVIQKGKGYTIDVISDVQEWDNPQPIIPKSQHPKDSGFKDLTGMKKGRFTVIGLLPGKGKKGYRWLVRCTCGKYTMRGTKSIKSTAKNPAAHHDACRQCTALAYLRRNEVWRRTGKNPDIQDFL